MSQETQLQTTESHPVAAASVETQPRTQPSKKLALPITSLAMRVSIFVFLLVALIVISTDTATTTNVYATVTTHFDKISAYRYVLSTIVLGLTYTLVQIPFAVIHLVSEKPLFKHQGFLVFDYIGDMVALSLLATGVGAGFGATLDLKRQMDNLDDLFQSYSVHQARVSFDKYFNTASLSIAFLLLAFICSIVSSVLSSLALFKKLYLK